MMNRKYTLPILVEVVNGAQYVEDADIERASTAAEHYLDGYGIDYAEAYNDYLAQMEAIGDESKMTGLAVHWIQARDIADTALTVNWAVPNGGGCSIYVNLDWIRFAAYDECSGKICGVGHTRNKAESNSTHINVIVVPVSVGMRRYLSTSDNLNGIDHVMHNNVLMTTSEYEAIEE